MKFRSLLIHAFQIGLFSGIVSLTVTPYTPYGFLISSVGFLSAFLALLTLSIDEKEIR